MRDLVKQREWRKNNPERVRAAEKRYFESPGIREKKLASLRQWGIDNPEKVRAYGKAYKKRPEVKARRYERYRKALGEGHKQSLAKYLEVNRDKIKKCQYSLKHYTTRKEYLWAYKAERGCKVCGEKDYICLDFHHRDGTTKHRSLIKDDKGNAKGSWFVLGLDALMEELNLVDVLCANCHRKLHRNESEKES
jgi:hypothetical protein